jgi:hypothetical protein
MNEFLFILLSLACKIIKYPWLTLVKLGLCYIIPLKLANDQEKHWIDEIFRITTFSQITYHSVRLTKTDTKSSIDSRSEARMELV